MVMVIVGQVNELVMSSEQVKNERNHPGATAGLGFIFVGIWLCECFLFIQEDSYLTKKRNNIHVVLYFQNSTRQWILVMSHGFEAGWLIEGNYLGRKSIFEIIDASFP